MEHVKARVFIRWRSFDCASSFARFAQDDKFRGGYAHETTSEWAGGLLVCLFRMRGSTSTLLLVLGAPLMFTACATMGPPQPPSLALPKAPTDLRAVRKAAEFGAQVQPDLVVLTGDILSHGRARAAVVAAMEGLHPPLGIFAVLGNHDVGDTHDPFSRGIVISDWGSAPVTVLRDRSVVVPWQGCEIELAGVDPLLFAQARNLPPEQLFTRPGAVRVLLSHFPEVPAKMPAGTCSLALCGHLHGGQICLPGPHGKVRLSHRSSRFDEGVFEEPDTTVVVSRGLGTTLLWNVT